MTETEDHIKVLVTASNQHIVAYLYPPSDFQNYYTVLDPMLIHYHSAYEENKATPKFEASFMRFCPLSSQNIFELRKDWIVSIADPDAGVLQSYQETVNNPVLIPQYYDSNSTSAE